jgi:hypothetical protein
MRESRDRICEHCCDLIVGNAYRVTSEEAGIALDRSSRFFWGHNEHRRNIDLGINALLLIPVVIGVVMLTRWNEGDPFSRKGIGSFYSAIRGRKFSRFTCG